MHKNQNWSMLRYWELTVPLALYFPCTKKPILHCISLILREIRREKKPYMGTIYTSNKNLHFIYCNKYLFYSFLCISDKYLSYVFLYFSQTFIMFFYASIINIYQLYF